MMALGSIYQVFYNTICGEHPFQKPWHFQWLPARSLRKGIRDALLRVQDGTSVLDVGCGTSPYKRWLPSTCVYTGLDVEGPATEVDIIIKQAEPWPLRSEIYDVVLCTEVLEHASDHALLLGEIQRVLKPGGLLILTVPFIYNEHGAPWDYRRFSPAGLELLLMDKYRVEATRRLGRIGTVLGTLLLNWVDASLGQRRPLRYLRVVLLPPWLLLCLVVNGLGVILDALDGTGAFYIDSLVVARKQ